MCAINLCDTCSLHEFSERILDTFILFSKSRELHQVLRLGCLKCFTILRRKQSLPGIKQRPHLAASGLNERAVISTRKHTSPFLKLLV